MRKLNRKKNRKYNKRWGLRDEEAVRKLLSHVTNALLRGDIQRESARAVGYLCGQILTTLAQKRELEVEQRLQAIEEKIRGLNQ
jgi:hypothetical protein